MIHQLAGLLSSVAPATETTLHLSPDALATLRRKLRYEQSRQQDEIKTIFGITFMRDDRLPTGWAELRHKNGEVLGRIVDID